RRAVRLHVPWRIQRMGALEETVPQGHEPNRSVRNVDRSQRAALDIRNRRGTGGTMTGNAVIAGLLGPLSVDAPCGKDLEGSSVLAAFDAYRLFGQQSYVGTRRPGQKEDEPPTPPNWTEIIEQSLAALAASKDL